MSRDNGFFPFIGWGISTLLLWLLNRGNNDSNDTSSIQASPYTDSNTNQIGSPVPVVLGRALIKNPLISYYGSFRADIYTEEYGLHSDLNVWSWLPLLLILLSLVAQKDTITFTAGVGVEDPSGKVAEGVTIANPSATSASNNTQGLDSSATQYKEVPKEKAPPPKNELYIVAGTGYKGNPYQAMTAQGPAQVTGSEGVTGTVENSNAGSKRSAMMSAIISFILWLLGMLLGGHLARTTIQKGFLYYLGWQHIICWTGDGIGIKKLWMNVYDPNVEESINKGVWDNNAKVAWKKDNPTGITAHIEDDQMFGGWDEGGGFIGDVRFYFGTYDQPKDPWMIKEMKAPTIPTDLQGLTPRYPMYFTCVVSDPNLDSGAYIGKQATIPEMWFEVVNYPNRLTEAGKDQVKKVYFDDVKKAYQKLLNYIGTTPESFHDYMKPWHGR